MIDYSVELSPADLSRCREFGHEVDSFHRRRRTHRDRWDAGDSESGNALGRVVELACARWYDAEHLLNWDVTGYDNGVDFWLQDHAVDIKRAKQTYGNAWINQTNSDPKKHEHFGCLVFVYGAIDPARESLVYVVGEISAAELVHVACLKPCPNQPEQLCYRIKTSQLWCPGAMLAVRPEKRQGFAIG